MSLMVVETPPALVALLRGWRAARLLLVTLADACWSVPAERGTAARAQGRPALRRTGSLYQI